VISHCAPTRVLRPRTLDELAGVLSASEGIPVIGGGTLAVAGWERQGAPEAVLHLPSVRELQERSKAHCGATARLADIVADDRMPRALRQAAASIGGPAVRNMATIGGNIVALQPGCLAVVLLAMGARCLILSRAQPGQTKVLPIQSVFMNEDALLLSVSWPEVPGGLAAFGKVAVRASGGPVIATVAVHTDGFAHRIAVGGTGSRPHRLIRAERAWQESAALPVITDIAGGEVSLAGPGIGSEGYRAAVVGTLAGRLVTAVQEARAT
jgi:CO/xanthine dehydrogenase FAD-binding subunit